MALPVTPGFGATIATEVKGQHHHQRVLAHRDLSLVRVIPALTAGRAYVAGQCVGAELLFNNAVRFAGDVAELREVLVVRAGSEQGVDLDLVLYSDERAVATADGQQFAVAAREAAGVTAVLQVRADEFVAVGGHAVAAVQCSGLVRGAVSAATVRGQLVARGAFSVVSAEDLAVSLGVERG